MEISFYQSECGDAARISFKGNDAKNHHIFIDAGYERTFRDCIRKDIEELIKNDEIIDYWIVSHIHDDHIGGVKKYIDYIKTGELKDIVANWIYNPPRFYADADSSFVSSSISHAESIGQGDILYNYLVEINKNSNRDYTNHSAFLDIHGLKIIFLTPTKDKLSALREKYNLSQMKPFKLMEDDFISEAVAAVKNDYNIKISDFDLNNWKEDDDVENGSSISFITEFEGKNILWLADAHPSDVVESLLKMGYSSQKKLKCEWVKITHHGSKGNNNNELYDLIDCANFLVSANGENRPKLPTKEALVKILRNRHRNADLKYRFYFTYDNLTLKSIFNVDDKDVYTTYNFENIFLKSKINTFKVEI